VTGQVQGVGFRPFVYRLATELGLAGFVTNNSAGAIVEIEGPASSCKLFEKFIVSKAPPLARIGRIEREELSVQGARGFRIDVSRREGSPTAEITIDTAVCEQCLAEMFDPANRRYRYPFINCTNCGPRYTIVTSIPYDRPNTTMARFAMCELCRAEYEDPASRRFHAQPIACSVCGPKLTLLDEKGRPIECDDEIAATAGLLREGKIVAIKGLGGFHLAVRARDDGAVRRLRQRKHRDHKPFAMMVKDLASGRAIAELDDSTSALLEDISRPIVLAPKRAGVAIAESVAPGLDTFGLMLPYTPVHYLLFAEGLDELVMTSGNISEEPLVKDNDEALQRLSGLADAFLVHDRDIERRVDDSVVQARAGGQMMVRRARGFVPRSIDIGQESPRAVLAVGGDLKNTVCLVKGRRALLSEHLGDLADARTYRGFTQTIEHLKALFDVEPEVVAADMHPSYYSSQEARQCRDVEQVQVQHHHGHAVACMTEHGLDGKVVGLCCDGTGYGLDGAVWGCEILVCDRADFARAGHLRYYGLPGGDAAAKETLRPAMSLLYETFGAEAFASPLARRLCRDDRKRQTIGQMLERKLNCPASSSLGRLFDAVSGLAGLGEVNHFEAQAAMTLEAAAADEVVDAYPYMLADENGCWVLDVRPMIAAIVEQIERREDPAVVSARFHNTVAAMLSEAAGRIAEANGLKKVVLSGGCFANRRLSYAVREGLEEAGLTVYEHRQLPCNDGGLSVGQAVVAVNRIT